MGWNILQGLLGRVGSEIGSKPHQPGHFARMEKGDGIKLVPIVHHIEKDYKATKKALHRHQAGEIVLDEEKMREHMNKMTEIVTNVLAEAINLFAWEIDNLKETLRADVKAEREGFSKDSAQRLIKELDDSLQKIAVASSEKGNILLSLSSEAGKDEIR